MVVVYGSMTVIAGSKAAGDGEIPETGAMKGPGGGEGGGTAWGICYLPEGW